MYEHQTVEVPERMIQVMHHGDHGMTANTRKMHQSFE
jgi:hypothetical protein